MTAEPTGWGHVVGTEKGGGQKEAQMSSTKGIKTLLFSKARTNGKCAPATHGTDSGSCVVLHVPPGATRRLPASRLSAGSFTIPPTCRGLPSATHCWREVRGLLFQSLPAAKTPSPSIQVLLITREGDHSSLAQHGSWAWSPGARAAPACGSQIGSVMWDSCEDLGREEKVLLSLDLLGHRAVG